MKRKHLCLLTMFLAVVIAMTFILGSGREDTMQSYAKTQEESQESSDTTTEKSLKEQYNDLKTKKETAKELLDAFESDKKDIVKYMHKLDKKLALLEDDLTNMKKQKEGISEYLSKVQEELEQDRVKEEEQFRAMKLRIQYMYEHGSNNYLDVITGSTSFGDMLNRGTYASMIQNYDNSLLKEYQKALDSIAEKEQVISEKNKELAQVTLDIKTEKEAVEALIDDKSEELKNYNHNISAASGLIAEYEASLKEQEEKMREAELAADSASDEMFADLPSEYHGGKLLWPAPGHYTISSPFGYRVHPLTGTRRLHGGIDIALPTGSSVYAAASGVVSISQYSSSAGNYIMINHSGSLSTVYMHKSKLLVKVGQHVKKGQKIAYSGSTGWSTGPHLHFGVRKNGAYVNPIPYLKSTSNSEDSDYSEEEDFYEDSSESSEDTSDASNEKETPDTSDSVTPEYKKEDSDV